MQREINSYVEGFERLFERLNSNDPYYADARNLQNELEEYARRNDFIDNSPGELARLIDQINTICESRLGITFYQLSGLDNLELSDRYVSIQQVYLTKLEDKLSHLSPKYTNLRITTDIRVATYRGQRLKQRPPKKERWWFQEALSEDDMTGNPARPRIVILGDPGAGKTTLCQKYAMELARENLEKITVKEKRRPIPVFLELNTYRADLIDLRGLKPYQRFLVLVAKSINGFLGDNEQNLSIDQSQVEEWMGTSSFTFLFDGLNEVGNQNRAQLLDDMRDFVDIFSQTNHQFIITTRKFDYEYELAQFFPDNKYELLEILELDGPGVNEFILRDIGNLENAYSIISALPNEIQSKSRITLEKIKEGDELDKRMDEFKEQIKKLPTDLNLAREALELYKELMMATNLIKLIRNPEYDGVLWLAQNPATLKDIIDVYKEKATIPKSRVKLFEQAIYTRVNTQAHKGTSQFPIDVKYKALQLLAYRMSDPREGLSLNIKTVLNIFSGVLVGYGLDGKDSANLLREIAYLDELLVERVQGEYSFIKQPYQELFVAKELRDCWRIATNLKKNPLADKKIRRFFLDRSYFQMASGISGLLEPSEVSGLLKYLRKRKSTQRLAALCIHNSEFADTIDVDSFIYWTRKKILSYAIFPEKFFDIILVTILMLSQVLAAGIYASPTKSLLSFIPELIDSLNLSFNSYLPQVVGIITIIFALIIWRLIYRNATYISLGVNISLVMPVIVISLGAIFDWFAPNWKPILLYINATAMIAVALQAFNLFLLPLSERMNIKFEEFIVHRRLTNYLEIMREIGPAATPVLFKIQQDIGANRYMSERVKDAINRT